MKKRIAFHTLGCKLNFSETSSIARQFRTSAYEIVDFREHADIYVINTCSVTGIAEKKCKQAIRQANRRNPDARIAVIGCFSQLKPEEIRSLNGVDIILGSNDKFNLHSIIDGQINFKTGDKENEVFCASFSSDDRTRSFVKIQDGCDYYCAYCTIPFARGHSRSGTITGVLDTVSEALQHNIREIILTGVNVGDFGRNSGESFFELLKALDEVNRLERIRISSIEPDLCTDEIIGLVADSSKLLPHFHIPLQSGSDPVLKAMKRRYTRDIFESRVLKIKEKMPFAFVAADVIVGFPGETESLFNETVEFIDKLPLSALHVFTFSERPDTLAAGLDNKVTDKEKHERSRILHLLGASKKESFYKQCKGLDVNVLFESENENGYISGFSENYIRVRTKYKPELINEIVSLKLINQDTDGIFVYDPE